MNTGAWMWTCLGLAVTICPSVITASPIGTSIINCADVTPNKHLGDVNEEYTGDVELVNGIEAGTRVKLVPFIFPAHLDFLELSFTHGDTSATVRTKRPLDADILAPSDSTLYYSVMCDSVIKYNNTRTLKLLDMNDNSPNFTQKVYSTTVSETQNVDTHVLQVMAVDGDSTPANNRVTYSIDPPPEDFTFTSGGALKLKRRLNYNLIREYNFIVTGQDSGGLNDTASVEIRVEDFDNLNPYFSHSLYQTRIPENQAATLNLLQPEAIKAQDGDTGINMTLTYSIGAVFPEKYWDNFDMDSSSGVVSVVAALDREEMSSSVISISIKVAQTDDRLKTGDTVLSVTVEDVNDNSPQFDEPRYSATLLENAPVDAVLFTAVVTDVDQGGFVGTLRILPDSAPFSISSDGTVTVKNSTALDRETIPTITFQIEAKESAPPRHLVTVPVTVTLLDVNDNSPRFSSSQYEGKVYANQTEGMLLVQVESEDADAGVNGEVRYSIDFGNHEGYFSIDEVTGWISLVKAVPLLENRILDFHLYVTARDQGVMSRSSSAVVNIRAPGDSKPQFLQKIYHGSVEEEQDAGAPILKLTFLAIAAEVPVTLQVQTHADKFSISSSGELTTVTQLDYDDGPHSYSMVVTLTDGSHSDSTLVLVQVSDINDNSPAFASTSVTRSVVEDAEVGANVTILAATDRDSGFNQELRYSLRGGGPSFSVHPLSGMVSVAAPLDRETVARYQLLVVAEDQGRPARSATATLVVQVSDVNDNAPKFSKAEYQVEVIETLTTDTSLLTLSAPDPDQGPNGRVTYSILQQNPASDPAVFQLDLSSGTLRLSRPLDFSQVEVYTLRVQASDGGSPSLVGHCSVVVKVKDVNNKPPRFSQDSYHVAVPENLASGASILSLQVTDQDQGGFSNGSFIYSSLTFDISQQGVVSLNRDVTLDRETVDRYVMEIVAVDQATDGLRATAQLNITILDYNDNAPQFQSLPDPLQIPEGSYSEESPGVVCTIVATDADLGPNAEVTLSFLSPNPLFRLREDGTLLAVGALDRERRDTYELVVQAVDRGRPQRENFTTVRVSLTDVNDNRPEFSSSSYVSSILLEEAEEGLQLLTLTASDRDVGNNSRLSYSFSAGSSPYLALNIETGAVTLTSDLADITKDTTLQLTAMATDHGQPPLSSTAAVVVNLRLASLVEVVAFLSSSYNFSIPENWPVGTRVGRVRASSGSDLYQVTYALKTHADLFSVGASGDIVTTAQLDKEQQEWFILEVEAADTRTPPTSAVAMVRVQVEDVNEPPQFPPEAYKASVFSIATYKTSVICVKASDPDVGDDGHLLYRVSGDSSHFDVEPSSGLLYVVSAAGLAAQTVVVEVKATDPRNLHATTQVEVAVQRGASSSDVVTLSLNQPANAVERKRSQLERSLGEALKWTVNIIQVWSVVGGASESRGPRATAKTSVSFFAVDGEQVVPAEDVTRKLQDQAAVVKEMLGQIFGADIHFDVEKDSQVSASNQDVVIALGVMLALSMLGLIVTVALVTRSEKRRGSKTSVFHSDGAAAGHLNLAMKLPEACDKEEMSADERTQEDEQQKTDGEDAPEDGQREGAGGGGSGSHGDDSCSSL